MALSSGAAVAESTDETVKVAPFHLDDASLPQTAGEADKSVRADSLCKADPSQTVSPADKLCKDAFAAGHIPELYRFQYECVFVISPDIGGAHTPKNVWLQPVDEVVAKRAADHELRKRVCEKTISLEQAQKETAEDWPAVYRRYVSNDVTVKIYEPPTEPPRHRATPTALVTDSTPEKSTTSADFSQPGVAGTPPIEASVVAGSDQSGTQMGTPGDRNRQNRLGDGRGLRGPPMAGRPAYGLSNGRAHPSFRR